MELDNFKYNLQKLKKCDQFWDDMKPVVGGRHCNSCNKTIVDFSQMTYSEIALFMSESQKPVCGFYLPEQLAGGNRKTNSIPLKIGLGTLLTATTISYGHSQSKQHDFETTIESARLIKSKNQEITTKPIHDTLVLKGKVQSFDTASKTIEVLPFASVIIKGTKIGVACNERGEFKLKYLPKVESEKIHIVISAVAIETKEISIDLMNQNEINLGVITLDKYKDDFTIFYVTGKKRSWLNRFWRKITFRKKSYYKYD